MSEKSNNYVFGLDIGTRSCVGIVGYMEDKKFHVCAQSVFEHEPRAMMDGQIHDIEKVSDTIKKVKKDLELKLGFTLKKTCIAAAGRVLKTITVSTEIQYEDDKNIENEDIFSLCTQGVEKAYEIFLQENDTDMRFYCVGYTPMRFYMNGYAIGNLENHKAKSIGVDLIATFLPDDVVDSLYKAVEGASLEVLNLTLEPIAAMTVAIPERFRTLNMALVDVGAGTSDISIPKEGSIVAYGMIPKAGDVFTNEVANHCFVEFDEAEKIKKASDVDGPIEYNDIMLLPQTIDSKDVLAVLNSKMEEITGDVSSRILELNGDKPVGACFVVGGGGRVKGFTDMLAQKIGIPNERVAIRGEEVMRDIIFDIDNPIKDSLMVTPIGIAISYYDKTNSFIFVNFNGKNIKLYDNNNLTVTDCALQASFPNQDLFPKSGKALEFIVNGKSRIIRGQLGEPAKIFVNGEEANMHTPVKNSDLVLIESSQYGEEAKAQVIDLAEMKDNLQIIVNGKEIVLSKTVVINGKHENPYYSITDGDKIDIPDYLLVESIVKQLDIDMPEKVFINDVPADTKSKVYNGFVLRFEGKKVKESESVTDVIETLATEAEDEYISEEDETQDIENASDLLTVSVNGISVSMSGKDNYVFVDVFDYINFDLNASRGRSIITKVNGATAEYMQPLEDGDIIEIYWQD